MAKTASELINELLLKIDQVAPDDRLRYIKEHARSLPPRERKVATSYIMVVLNSVEASERSAHRLDRRVAFATATTFILLIICIALLLPEPSPFQYTVLRIVLALMAGAFGQAAVSGLLEVKVGKVIRASSAAAMFVIVYFFAPAVIPDGSGREQSSITADRAAG